MQRTKFAPDQLIVRRSQAGPQILSPELSAGARGASMYYRESQSDNMEHTESVIETPKIIQKEKEVNLSIEGKIILVSQILAPKEALCVSYTETYDYIAAGYSDGVIRMYRTDTNEPSFRLSDIEVNRAPVTSLRHRPVSKNYPITNSFTCTYANGCVKCWNYNFNQCLYTIREKRQTYGITYHPRLPKFVTYGDDGNIYMYDEETRTQERILTKSENPDVHDGHTSRVYAGCFNPRSNHELCTGGWDNVVQFWDLRQPHAIRHLSGIHICAEGIDITQKGTEILTCAFQKNTPMQLWDYASGKLIANAEPDIYNSKLYTGRFMGRDFLVSGGTEPNILRIVDTNTLVSKAFVTNLPSAIYALDLGPQIKLKRQSERQNKNDLVGMSRIAFVSGKGVYQIEPF